MEYFVDTERISLDYSEDRTIKEMPAYRLTLYDKYGHFVDDVQLTKEDVRNMYESLDAVKNTL